MLSKMAELLETLISWSLKTMLGAVLGLQAVRGLVAPAMDAIKRTAIGKTAGAIPAVGNAVNVVTELILTGALLVKNCLVQGRRSTAAYFPLATVSLPPRPSRCQISGLWAALEPWEKGAPCSFGS